MKKVLRTPDEQFCDLPDFQFDPVYIDGLKGFEDLRMRYVDEGQIRTTLSCAYTANSNVGYLYRRMIPILRPTVIAWSHRIFLVSGAQINQWTMPFIRLTFTAIRSLPLSTT